MGVGKLYVGSGKKLEMKVCESGLITIMEPISPHGSFAFGKFS